MNIFVQTRGFLSSQGYRWLGSENPEEWWSEFTERLGWIQPSRPSILFASKKTHWSLLATGIPTARTDWRGRLIRANLAAECSRDSQECALNILLSLAQIWMTDLGKSSWSPPLLDVPYSNLGELIDQILTTDVIRKLYDSPDDFDIYSWKLYESLGRL